MAYKQFCVIFNDEKSRVLLGNNAEDIRNRYRNVKRVFKMGDK